MAHGAGDYRAAADDVVWLEARGYPAIPALVADLPELRSVRPQPPQIEQRESQSIIVNLAGQSLFAFVSAIADFAGVEAARSKKFHVSVQQSRSHLAIIAATRAKSLQNLYAAARWRDAETGGVLTMLVLRREHDAIVVRSDPGSIEAPADGVVEFVCAAGAPAIEESIPGFRGHGQPWQLDGRPGDSIFESCLESGLEVDRAHYALLVETAGRVLVEATEQSRSGAGE